MLCLTESLGYIGYSQGGTTLFALLADQPKYGEKLKPAIAIAPAVRLDNYASSMKPIFENPLIMTYVKNRGGECFPYFEHDPKALCKAPLVKPICDYVTYNFLTINKKQVNQSRVGVQIAHLPSGTSCWDILHYLQIMKSRKFTKFDYGWTENFKRYGNIFPPEYPLDKIDTKYLSIIVSIGDHTADPNDIYTLKRLLKSGKPIWTEFSRMLWKFYVQITLIIELTLGLILYPNSSLHQRIHHNG